MILDENGQIRFNGVTDFEDGPVTAGLCALFDLPEFAKINPSSYLKEPSKENPFVSMYRRCIDSKYLFSRDQTIMVAAYYYKNQMTDFVGLERVDGKDLFSPSVRGHIRRCQGGKANWFQDAWLWLDVLFHAKHTPTDESNQLLAMMMIHPDKKYLKWWCKNNPQWWISIAEYFTGWRNEPELAQIMIDKIKSQLSE